MTKDDAYQYIEQPTPNGDEVAFRAVHCGKLGFISDSMCRGYQNYYRKGGEYNYDKTK